MAKALCVCKRSDACTWATRPNRPVLRSRMAARRTRAASFLECASEIPEGVAGFQDPVASIGEYPERIGRLVGVELGEFDGERFGLSRNTGSEVGLTMVEEASQVLDGGRVRGHVGAP